MKKIWRKFIVFAAIGLFIGAGILPNINSEVTFYDIQDQEQQSETVTEQLCCISLSYFSLSHLWVIDCISQ